jgi:hypothetical protein
MEGRGGKAGSAIKGQAKEEDMLHGESQTWVEASV